MKENSIKLGLTYDDVLLIPQYSDVPSRKPEFISLETDFSRRIRLNMPVVSANMDTVTESRMAIAMARAGGIGVIHRFLSIEDQRKEVVKVKRAQNLIIDDPMMISPEATLAEAMKLMSSHGISGLLVCDEDNRLKGLLTSRDVRFKKDLQIKVKAAMTPRARLVTAPPDTTAAGAMVFFDEFKIEKLPLINAKGEVVGLITSSDFQKINDYADAAKDQDGQLLVGAAVGVKDGLERASALAEAGCNALVIDIAHGHHDKCLKLTESLKDKFPEVDVVAGNVATAKGALDLIRAGADAVKVGIGPGAACSTRIVAGVGVPQLTAIMDVAPVCKKHNTPLIADGGIKNSGDVTKAIAAGASTVMIGNMLAGSDESPGEYFIEEGMACKVYRGLASREASTDRQFVEESVDKDRQERAPEGVSFKVAYKGEVEKILRALLIDGLRSGMSYSGARNIREFWRKARFIRMTEAGTRESMPRSHQI